MAEIFTDGNSAWSGGIDTSRRPSQIDASQYSKASNVVVLDNEGQLRVRFGFHYVDIRFEDKFTEDLYREGTIQAQGWFESNNIIYLIVVIDGYVLRMKMVSKNIFKASTVNKYSRNLLTVGKAWVIRIPNACIVNNGFDNPIYITASSVKRTKPEKDEIGPGCAGVYLQNRLFYIDRDQQRILASDFLKPLSFTREETNIFGFACPDADVKIVAIGKQKIVNGTVEGGNLIWSSTKDIYSADVRGSRSEWASLSTNVGKTSETIPNFSAVSPYSFEPFNTNLYFRSERYGLSDIRQAGYQFVNLDAANDHSPQAAYYFDNDSKYLLDYCYTAACNGRLYTTVAPEIEDTGVIWNGLISYNPMSVYQTGKTQQRYESVFTGLRPWGITVAKDGNNDIMFIHSRDKNGYNSLYYMDENTDYDTDQAGRRIEIKGFLETRAYNFQNPFAYKKPYKRMYSLGVLERSVCIDVFSRSEEQGEWVHFWSQNHLVCRDYTSNGSFQLTPHKGQTRHIVNLPEEKRSECNGALNFFEIQYRIEFVGPIKLNAFISSAVPTQIDSTIREEKTCNVLVYSYRPDYYYEIVSDNNIIIKSTEEQPAAPSNPTIIVSDYVEDQNINFSEIFFDALEN